MNHLLRPRIWPPFRLGTKDYALSTKIQRSRRSEVRRQMIVNFEFRNVDSVLHAPCYALSPILQLADDMSQIVRHRFNVFQISRYRIVVGRLVPLKLGLFLDMRF